MRALLAALALALLAGCASPAAEPPVPEWRLGPPKSFASDHSLGEAEPCHPWGAWHAAGSFTALREAAGKQGAVERPTPPSLPLRVEALEAAWNGPALTRVSVERTVDGTATALALAPTGRTDAHVLSAIFPHEFTDDEVRGWFHGLADAIGLPGGAAREALSDRLVAAREPGMEMGASGRGTWIVSDTASVWMEGPLDLPGAYARAAQAAKGVVQSVGEGAWLTFATVEGRVVLEYALPAIQLELGSHGLRAVAYGSDWTVAWSGEAPPASAEGRQEGIAAAYQAAGLPTPRFAEWVSGPQEC